MLNTHLHNYYGNFESKQGFIFRAYAPNVDSVCIKVNNEKYQMTKINSDAWEVFIDNVKSDTPYHLLLEKDDEVQKKCDPFAKHCKVDTNNKSLFGEPVSHTFASKYTQKNKVVKNVSNDMLILEVFLEHVDGKTFQEKAVTILNRMKYLEKSFTHVQMMPVQTHSFKNSLGYKTSTPYSVNSKFGDPDDFKEMIDILHKGGIGVIIDFVILEFEEYTKHGLLDYGFEPTFTHDDEKQHDIFTGYLFDLHKTFVKEYILSAIKNLSDYGVDGFRMDGINELIFNDNRVNIEYDTKNLEIVRDFFSYLEKPIIIIENITFVTNEILKIPNVDFIENSMAMYDIRNVLQQPSYKRPNFRLQKEFDDKEPLDDTDSVLASATHDLFVTGKNKTLRRPYSEIMCAGEEQLAKSVAVLLKAIYANKHRKLIYSDFDATKEKVIEPNFIKFTNFFDEIIGNQSNVKKVKKRQVDAAAIYHYTLIDGDMYIFIFNLSDDDFKFAIDGHDITEIFEHIYNEGETTYSEGTLTFQGLTANVFKVKK